MYCEARTLAESLDVEETGFSTIQMVKVRVGVYERAALASNTFAVIQHSKVIFDLDGLDSN